MKDLANVINESVELYESTSDAAILYRMGIYRLRHISERYTDDQLKRLFQRFGITQSNPRAGIIKYMRHDTSPLPKPSEEFIDRAEWKLDSLVGETEGQLMHPDYYRMAEHIIKTHKRQHDTLSMFQCSSKKPYTENRILKYGYFQVYKDQTDFACLSNPGVIPVEYCDKYPYRYDEWDVSAETKAAEELELTKKYRIVNMCRFLRYVREMGYKDVIACIGNVNKQWIFEEIKKKNIEGGAKWMHVVLDDTFRNKLSNSSKYKDVPQGIIFSRIVNYPETAERYGKFLIKYTSGDDAIGAKKALKDRLEHLKKGHESRQDESLQVNEGYQIKKKIDYGEFLSNFKKKIKDNMEDPSVDLGENKLYYKSYYWTTLDLLLIALDGDLVEDIDKEYWELHKKLVADKDFTLLNPDEETYGNFCYAYEPLLEHDDVDIKSCFKEAMEEGIIKENSKSLLNDMLKQIFDK